MNKDTLFLENSNVMINSSTIPSIKHKYKDLLVTEVNVDKKLSLKLQKNIGKYITLMYDDNLLINNSKKLEKYFIINFKKVLKYLLLNSRSKILIVGLGNKNITSDSLGFHLIENLDLKENSRISKIHKEVEGNTNIDTFEFISSLVKDLNIDAVIIVDSLKAYSINRLNNTIQISTGGITPGSASNNSNSEISNITLGIPCIALGVPLVIDASVLSEKDELKKLLVSTKEVDFYIEKTVKIISSSLRKIFIK
ncbi:MAG: GPR endopeptidase [Bacilli bacterium]